MLGRTLVVGGVGTARFERPEPFATPEVIALTKEEAGPKSTLFRALSALPLRLVHQATYSWSGRANSVQIVTLAKRIDTTGYIAGTLSVRVHSTARWSNTALLRVILQNVAPTPDDPSKAFPGSNVATVSISSAASAPLLSTVELDDAPLGPWLRLALRWEQGANTVGVGVDQDVSLSVDLMGRPAALDDDREKTSTTDE